LTEWLDAGGLGVTTCLDAAGRRMVGGSSQSRVIILDVPVAPTPVPAAFLTFAEAAAGHSLNARGNFDLLSVEKMEEAWRRIAVTSSDDFYDRLARWFLADPLQRTLSPF